MTTPTPDASLPQTPRTGRNRGLPRDFWAYANGDEILPSTIREREGDCDSALKKTDIKYRPKEVRKVRVTVELEESARIAREQLQAERDDARHRLAMIEGGETAPKTWNQMYDENEALQRDLATLKARVEELEDCLRAIMPLIDRLPALDEDTLSDLEYHSALTQSALRTARAAIDKARLAGA